MLRSYFPWPPSDDGKMYFTMTQTLKRKATVFGLLLFCWAWGTAAQDWPMWRGNAGHTGVTAHSLPDTLQVHWSRDLRPPQAAWPQSQDKLQFDVSYEPVVAGKRLFVPSMVADRLTAYSTETGEELWRHYADGPLRFAAVCFDDKVAFGSDDGTVTCLRAEDGAVVWRVRGGPDARVVLGNDRLISMWPVRGAPVVYDGTIYFAAGIWPFMGTFIHARRAGDGGEIWVNSGSGSAYLSQPHFSPAFAGVAPQGYIAVTPDRLLVAGGRSVPGGYERETGRFLYCDLASRQFGKQAGGYGVSAADDWFMNGHALYNAADGKGLSGTGPAMLADGIVYSCTGSGVAGFGEPLMGVERRDKRGRILVSTHLSRLWQVKLKPAPERLLIKAAGRFYGLSEDGSILAISSDPAENGKPAMEVVWEAELEGTPWTMLAADQRLFVVTREGRLYCLGAGERGPLHYPRKPSDPATQPGQAATDRVLGLCGARSGYALCLGLGDGEQAAALAARSEMHVMVVDADVAAVNAFRRRMDDAGLYGTRVSAWAGDPLSFSFPPYVADLIVLDEALAAAVVQGRSPGNALLDALRPYGGTALWPVPAGSEEALPACYAKAGVETLSFARDGEFMVVRRVGPLPGSASWTHENADVANSLTSRDQRVRGPLGLLWFGGPPNDPILPRHGHGPTPQVAGGRVFIEGRDLLRAVDVYTGRLLWERNLPGIGTFHDYTGHQPGANEIGSNYVSTPDTVYAVLPDGCELLEPATGKTRRRFTLPVGASGEQPRWGFAAVLDDLLLATAMPIGIRETDESKAMDDEEGTEPLIPQHATWRYLGGSHPAEQWAGTSFDDSMWPEGKAGFGYGDKDDNTELKDMRQRYTAVYIRRSFVLEDPEALEKLILLVRYDDAFIAYLNGEEIARRGVGEGRGAKASKLRGHEAGGTYTKIALDGADLLFVLKKGKNVLALEGHNGSLKSSDFTLDPYVLGRLVTNDGESKEPAPEPVSPTMAEIPGVTVNTEYAARSRQLVVMDRHTGERLWSREARYGFRHNAVVAGAGRVFCIDGLSTPRLAYLKRRGFAPAEPPTLYCLEARTGNVVWQTTEAVFGTWLGYSEEHDVLLQAGSAARDRADDETKTGMVAYQAQDGQVLWQDLKLSYTGPCLLYHDAIITQSNALELKTGKPVSVTHPLTGESVPWQFKRNYGCNTIVASEHLLTFRSAAAGYATPLGVGGTANLGGFKSGCTSSLIVADGVLNAPDYTRTCICAYQNQASLALVPMADVETWTFSGLKKATGRIRRVGLNLNAPGDRLESGTLWLDYPSVGGPSPDPTVTTTPDQLARFRHHASASASTELNWVGASGVEGLQQLTLKLADDGVDTEVLYTVRLVFAEPSTVAPKGRVFDVALQGKTVLPAFDIRTSAGAARTAITRTFRGVNVGAALRVDLTASVGSKHPPILCGIECVAE